MSVPIFFFGLAIVAAGILAGVQLSNLIKTCTEPIDGTVTGYEANRGSRGGTIYCPIITYWVNGAEYQLKNSNCSDRPKYPEGERIPLRYNPAKPEKCYAVNEKNSLIGGIIVILFGVGMAALSFVL